MDIEQQAPVCYRHPDRETRLACSNCGRYICAECSHDAAVGQRCPHCAAPEHRTRIVRSTDIGRTDWRTAPVSVGIIAVTVLVFLIDASAGLGRYAQFNPRIEVGEWWRIFTAGFLHGGLLHLLVNMYVLWIFGPRLEREAGSLPFAGLYFASMAAGGAAYYLGYVIAGSPGPAVGASGATFGLLGVWLVATYRIRHTPFGSSMFRQLVFWLGLSAVMSLPFVGLNIAWEAHLGGLLAGAFIGWAWATFASGKPNAEAIRTSIAVAVLAVALAVVRFF